MLSLLFYVVVLKDQAEDLPGPWKTERDEMA